MTKPRKRNTRKCENCQHCRTAGHSLPYCTRLELWVQHGAEPDKDQDCFEERGEE